MKTEQEWDVVVFEKVGEVERTICYKRFKDYLSIQVECGPDQTVFVPSYPQASTIHRSKVTLSEE